MEPIDTVTARPCSIERVRRRFAERGPAGNRVRGDHDLNPDYTVPASLRDAAVLIPLVARPEGPAIILTQRAPDLAAHAGQICLPGGRRESFDASPEDNALRETAEEIGLDRSRIDVLGRLDTYVSRTGFRIVPVVGVVQAPFTLAPDPVEVAEVFEVPLAVILAPGNPERHSREGLDRDGHPRQRWFHAFTHRRRFIWGVTAGILNNLRDVLGGES
jgi:8-oxo-dGTP pyrophosphatase MutT (NUDIX family)